MRKEDADKFKAEEDAIESDATGKGKPLDHFKRDDLEQAVHRLNRITEVLEDEISDYALDKTTDYLDADEPVMVRSFWWSKGMSDHLVVLDSDFQFRGHSDEVPEALLLNIANTIIAGLYHS